MNGYKKTPAVACKFAFGAKIAAKVCPQFFGTSIKGATRVCAFTQSVKAAGAVLSVVVKLFRPRAAKTACTVMKSLRPKILLTKRARRVSRNSKRRLYPAAGEFDANAAAARSSHPILSRAATQVSSF